ncbi:MAG: ABC transporter ATP-binding protein [Erysipelotrichaceae bacterium]|nr:ABC transporter ATP-binding protein [Erysipelotrichaceae bacterium]
MIEVRNLSFSYKNQPVFNDLSFQLNDFSMAALLGLNGEGKTTLIKLMLGLLKPDNGEILINGKDIHKISENARSKLLSYVPQEMDSALSMTVSDFICMGAMNRQNIFSGPKEKDRRQAADILLNLDISDLEHSDINRLSSGQRRMAYLARTIFQNSDILIMDEPVNSLDYLKQHRFLSTLKNYIMNNDRKVIMSIHDPSLAYQYADTFLFFKDHGLSGILSRKDHDFEEAMCRNVSFIYDGKVDVSILNNQLLINIKTNNG